MPFQPVIGWGGPDDELEGDDPVLFDDPNHPYYGMTSSEYARQTGLDRGNATSYTTPITGQTGMLTPSAAEPEDIARYEQHERDNLSFREENEWFDPLMIAGMFSLGALAGTGVIGGGAGGGGAAAGGAQTFPYTAPGGSIQVTPLAGGGAGGAAPAVADMAGAGVRLPPGAGSTGMTGVPGVGPTVVQPPSSGGLLSRVGGWVRDNPETVAGIVGGIGEGLLSSAAAEDRLNAERDLMRERQGIIDRNYGGVDPGRSFRSLSPGRSGVNPAVRFSPGYYGSFEYRFDPAQGRIVKVPVEQP